MKLTMDIGGEKKESVGKGEGNKRLPDRPKAATIKGVVLCNRCQCECELEIPALGGIVDQNLVRKER